MPLKESTVCCLYFIVRNMNVPTNLFGVYNAVLSISFKVDAPTGKVGAAYFSSTKGASFLGGPEGMPPQKILKFRCLEMLCFPDSIWALRTIKIKYVYCNCSFPQNLNHWLLEKSEGVWGHTPPPPKKKCWNLDAWKCYFHCFPDSIWALKQSRLTLY